MLEQSLRDHYNNTLQYYSPMRAETIGPLFWTCWDGIGSILDIGCGTGWFLGAIRHLSGFKLGIDCSIERLKLVDRGINVCCLDMEDERWFDYIDLSCLCCWDVLEHLPVETIQMITEYSSRLIGTVPLRDSYVAHKTVFSGVEHVRSVFQRDGAYRAWSDNGKAYCHFVLD